MKKILRVITGNMKYGVVAVSNLCNCRCKMCNIWKHDTKSLSLNDGLEILDLLYNNKFGFVQFTGGEPTLYPHLTYLIWYSSNVLDMYTSIPSNGTMITDSLAFCLKNSGLDLCALSIDHYKPAVCDKIRGHKDILSKVIQSIEHLKKYNISISSSTTINIHNYDEIPQMVDFINNDLGIPFGICYPEISDVSTYKLGGDRKTIELTNSQLLSTFEEILYLKKKGCKIYNTYSYLDEVIRFLKQEKPKYLCHAGRDVVYIDWNGDIYPCFNRDKMCNYKNFEKLLDTKNCNKCMLECFREPSIFTGSFRGKVSMLKDINNMMKMV